MAAKYDGLSKRTHGFQDKLLTNSVHSPRKRRRVSTRINEEANIKFAKVPESGDVSVFCPVTTSTQIHDDDMWGEDIPDDDLDECVMLATQQLSVQPLQSVKETPMPRTMLSSAPEFPNHNSLRQQKTKSKPSTSEHLMSGPSKAISSFHTETVDVLKQEIDRLQNENKRLKDQEYTQQGEVSILRSQINQRDAALQQANMDRMNQVAEKVNQHKEEVQQLKKTINALDSQLKFKTQEAQEASARCYQASNSSSATRRKEDASQTARKASPKATAGFLTVANFSEAPSLKVQKRDQETQVGNWEWRLRKHLSLKSDAGKLSGRVLMYHMFSYVRRHDGKAAVSGFPHRDTDWLVLLQEASVSTSKSQNFLCNVCVEAVSNVDHYRQSVEEWILTKCTNKSSFIQGTSSCDKTPSEETSENCSETGIVCDIPNACITTCLDSLSEMCRCILASDHSYCLLPETNLYMSLDKVVDHVLCIMDVLKDQPGISFGNVMESCLIFISSLPSTCLQDEARHTRLFQFLEKFIKNCVSRQVLTQILHLLTILSSDWSMIQSFCTKSETCLASSLSNSVVYSCKKLNYSPLVLDLTKHYLRWVSQFLILHPITTDVPSMNENSFSKCECRRNVFIGLSFLLYYTGKKTDYFKDDQTLDVLKCGLVLLSQFFCKDSALVCETGANFKFFIIFLQMLRDNKDKLHLLECESLALEDLISMYITLK